MSTNTIDSALDFMPEATKRPASAGGMLATIKDVLASISQGHAAAGRYRSLVGAGMSPDEAAARIHAEFFARD